MVPYSRCFTLFLMGFFFLSVHSVYLVTRLQKFEGQKKRKYFYLAFDEERKNFLV